MSDPIPQKPRHERADKAAPARLDNPPGQAELAYRLSQHSGFLARMIARLSQESLPDGDHKGQRPLRPLTGRSQDDFALGLLDAWRGRYGCQNERVLTYEAIYHKPNA